MLGAHKAAVVRTAIEAASLSPTLLTRTDRSRSDFNFIEQAFAKLNARLRTVVARTVAYLWIAVHHDLGRFKAWGCSNVTAATKYETDLAVTTRPGTILEKASVSRWRTY